jgi:uncharacterized membrane protein YdjX (TVP38/TMEM64 family)
MPFWRFTVLSFLGSIPWVVALAFAGHALGGDWTSVRKYFQYVDYLVLLLIAGGIAYAIVRRRGRGNSTDDAAAGVEAGAGPNPDAATTGGAAGSDAAVDAG